MSASANNASKIIGVAQTAANAAIIH